MGTISLTQLIILGLIIILMFGDVSKVFKKLKKNIKKK